MNYLSLVKLLPLAALLLSLSARADEEACRIISNFAGIDVNERRTNDTFRFTLKKPAGMFRPGVANLDWDGAVKQLLFHAPVPDKVPSKTILAHLDWVVPDLCKRLDCKLVTKEPDGEGRLKWTLAMNASDEWKVEVCWIDRKAPARRLATLSIWRPTFVDGLTPSESEKVSVPTEPPTGNIGTGQDATWVRATFPRDADMILKKGYDAWLMEWVGIMRQNGHFKTTIRIPALPEGGCDLHLGPYHVKVAQPGNYAFPLEVLKDYKLRLDPNVPFTREDDDGFRKAEWFYNRSPRRGNKIF